MSKLFLPLVMIAASCTTDQAAYNRAHPCDTLTQTLGPSHQCTVHEGGALDEFEVRREITSRVIIEGQTLPHKEFGKRAIVFDQDGHYEARKLHFTQYWTMRGSEKVFLVYAEDSLGDYRIEKDGTIILDEPRESTCRDRTKGGDETLAAHLLYITREGPHAYRGHKRTLVAFENQGWLKDFHGYDTWQGEAEFRGNVQWPVFPKYFEKPTSYRFDGLSTEIHYGCLDQGFLDFRGNEQIYLAEDFRYDEGVNPWRLRAGTRLQGTP